MGSGGLGLDSDLIANRLALDAEQAIRTDGRRIVVIGASGWIGRALLALLDLALGSDVARQRILCFGSQARLLSIAPHLSFPQRPLSELAMLERQPTLLFHLAFLTKDKVARLAEAEYERLNRELSQQVLRSLDPIGVDRLFIASSGAAAFADVAGAAHDLRLYGRLKREDEERFAQWAREDQTSRRAVIARIFNISGPYINKHQIYALASFILDALAGRSIEVRAPMRVIRGYVAVRELLSLVVLALLRGKEPVLHFDTGGESLELGEVAARVAQVIGGAGVDRREITVASENRYVGDDARYRSLIGKFGLEHIPLSSQIAETAAFLARLG